MTAKRRGLGRGLNALLGEADAPAGDDGLRSLPIEYLKPSSFQPRKDIDPQRLQELADSIKAQGVVQPIVVRSIAENRYEIIAGERRWRAAQLAGLRELPVVLREVSDQTAIALALIENIQREDLNAMEEAESLKRLLSEFSMTHQEIADAIGKSRTTVTNLLRLNELHPEVKLLVHDGSLEMGHARAILSLEHAKQAPVAQKIASRKMTVRAAERLIKELMTAGKSGRKGPDADIRRLEDQISQRLGARVHIRHGAKGMGKVIIDYSSLDQLEGLLEKFR
jgi:ParB family chromosome partitioning protein